MLAIAIACREESKILASGTLEWYGDKASSLTEFVGAHDYRVYEMCDVMERWEATGTPHEHRDAATEIIKKIVKTSH
jgi:hypothetical protein